MYAKILISGQIKLKTGLHIGGGSDIGMIGTVDSPVIKDPYTRRPIIPGSSLKGKLRYLLALDKADGKIDYETHNGDSVEVLRLFGSSEKNNIQLSRLQFSDCFLSEKSIQRAMKSNFDFTENKYENTIDRNTTEANPRQIERVVKDNVFDFEIIYNVENMEDLAVDFENIQLAFDILRNDYLGGGGTRGNGRVDFIFNPLKVVVGDLDISAIKLQ